MKKLSILLLSAALLMGGTTAFARRQGVVKADSVSVTARAVSGFDAIHIQGPFDVYISQGTSESLKLEAPEEILPRIITEVHGGTLEIRNKHDNWGTGEKSWYSEKSWWRRHKEKIKVYVTVKYLNSIKLSGSGGAFFNEGITANSLKLRVRGSGSIQGKVAVKQLQSFISGSGNIKLSGTAQSSAIRMTGSGNFNAPELVTTNSAVKVSGSGGARINASDRVDAAISGSGEVSYTGTAKTINSTKSGSGSISRF